MSAGDGAGGELTQVAHSGLELVEQGVEGLELADAPVALDFADEGADRQEVHEVMHAEVEVS